MTTTKALFAAALCFGLAACSTTETTTSGSSDSSKTGASLPADQWNSSDTSTQGTPGTSPTKPSNADDNSVK